MNKITTTLIIIALVSLFFYAMFEGLKQFEKTECLKWQEQAKEYEDYYLTEWQKLQCKHYNIEIQLN